MKRITQPPAIGTQPARPGQWVQTDRKAHEEWARMSIRKPAAGALLHHLVAFMGNKNAVVVSQKVLAALLGVSLRTIGYSLETLASEKWIQIVRLGKGKEAAYVVNSRVAWGEKRENLRLSAFSAEVVADYADQGTLSLDDAPLRRIPVLLPWERQLPIGDGEPPLSQPHLPDMEPDLPSLEAHRDWPEALTEEEWKAGKPCPICALGLEPNAETIAALEDTHTEKVTLEQMQAMMYADD